MWKDIGLSLTDRCHAVLQTMVETLFSRDVECKLQHKDSLMDDGSFLACQRAKIQKEGHEDQGALQQLGGRSLSIFISLSLWLWAPWQPIKLAQSIKLSLC